MELKPLYLAAGCNWQVSHEERALKVQRQGRAPAWYPFRRLARVISATDVDWTSGSLVACLRSGITVSFTDGYGRPEGFCYGIRQREATFDQMLQIALEHDQWEVRFRHWRQGMARQSILKTKTALGVELRSLEPEQAHAGFCNHHYLRTGRRMAPLLRAMDGAIHALVAARLAQDLSPKRLGHTHPGFCIVAEFAAILRWPTHRTLAGMDSRQLDELGPNHAAAVLLATCPQVSDELGVLIHRFQMWLRNLTL